MCMHLHACTHMCMHDCIYAHIHVCTHAHICTHTNVYTHAHTYFLPTRVPGSLHLGCWRCPGALWGAEWGQDQSSDVMAIKPSCGLSTIRKNWSAEGVAPRPRAHFLPVLRGRMQWVRGKLVLPQLWLISRSLLHVCPQWPPITPWHMPICSPGLGRCGHPGACEGRPQMAHSSLSSAQKLEDLG